jgi:hypothetical protein
VTCDVKSGQQQQISPTLFATTTHGGGGHANSNLSNARNARRAGRRWRGRRHGRALERAPASAQSQASCEQDYAAKQAAGQTGVQSKASYVDACLAGEKTAPAPVAQGAVAGDDTAGQSPGDLAKNLQNSIGDLYSFPFQGKLLRRDVSYQPRCQGVGANGSNLTFESAFGLLLGQRPG